MMRRIIPSVLALVAAVLVAAAVVGVAEARCVCVYALGVGACALRDRQQKRMLTKGETDPCVTPHMP